MYIIFENVPNVVCLNRKSKQFHIISIIYNKWYTKLLVVKEHNIIYQYTHTYTV